MRARRISVVCVCLLLAMALPALAEEIDKHFHESFDINRGARLNLDHGDGDVTIVPWDKNVIDVEVQYRAESSTVGWSRRTDFDVEFRQTGDTVRIIAKEPSISGVGFLSFREHEYTYTVQAPDWVELELKGEDGNVELEAWTGLIQIRLDDGDVSLSDIRSASTDLRLEDGDLEIRGISGVLAVESDDGNVRLSDCNLESARIELEDGDLKVRDCSGNIRALADDGDLHLSRLQGSHLDFETSDGDIDLDLIAASDLDLQIRTDDGNVNLGLEPSISAEFDISSDDGSIRIDVPEVDDLRKERGRVSGRLGDGSGRIRISVNDGRVVLRETRSDI